MLERSGILKLDMNTLPFSKQVAVVSALVEGNSIRATGHMTGVVKVAILARLENPHPAAAILAEAGREGA